MPLPRRAYVAWPTPEQMEEVRRAEETMREKKAAEKRRLEEVKDRVVDAKRDLRLAQTNLLALESGLVDKIDETRQRAEEGGYQLGETRLLGLPISIEETPSEVLAYIPLQGANIPEGMRVELALAFSERSPFDFSYGEADKEADWWHREDLQWFREVGDAILPIALWGYPEVREGWDNEACVTILSAFVVLGEKTIALMAYR